MVYGYCMDCKEKRSVEITSDIKIMKRQTKNNRVVSILHGKCPECPTRVYTIIANEPIKEKQTGGKNFVPPENQLRALGRPIRRSRPIRFNPPDLSSLIGSSATTTVTDPETGRRRRVRRPGTNQTGGKTHKKAPVAKKAGAYLSQRC